MRQACSFGVFVVVLHLAMMSRDRWGPCGYGHHLDDPDFSLYQLSRKLVEDLRHDDGLYNFMQPLTGLVSFRDIQRFRRRYRDLSWHQFEAAVGCNERLVLQGDLVGARNGHTHDGIIGISEVDTQPPKFLLHWTQQCHISSIMQWGILPKRRAVHLTAARGDKPRGSNISIQVDTEAALREGVTFRKFSETGYTVWRMGVENYEWASLPVNCISLASECAITSSRRHHLSPYPSCWLPSLSDGRAASFHDEGGEANNLYGLYIGCYVQQTIGHVQGRSKLPWYAHQPSLQIADQLSRTGLDRGTFFGPVRALEDTRPTHGFVSVLVPCPKEVPADYRGTPQSSFWINVCKVNAHKSCAFWCCVVPTEVVRSWEERGWWHSQADCRVADMCPDCRGHHGQHESGSVMDCGCCAGTCELCDDDWGGVI